MGWTVREEGVNERMTRHASIVSLPGERGIAIQSRHTGDPLMARTQETG